MLFRSDGSIRVSFVGYQTQTLSDMKRKKMIIGTSCIFVLLIVVLLGASQYMLNYSLRPKNRGKNLESSWQYMFKTYSYLKPWIDSLKQNQALKDTFIYSPDHVKLHAYYVASSRPTAKTAIIVHGYTDNAIRMMMIGYLYNKKLDWHTVRQVYLPPIP